VSEDDASVGGGDLGVLNTNNEALQEAGKDLNIKVLEIKE
jgi:hypothetical protein